MSCCGRRRQHAGATTPDGLTVTGFVLTFPAELNRAPETFLTKLEAERERRLAGGGQIEPKTK